MRERMLIVLAAVASLGGGTVGGGAPGPMAETEAPVDAPWFRAKTTPDGPERLYVGRLSSRTFEVATGDGVEGSGPVDGQVLAWWIDDGVSRMVLVNTADGQTQNIIERDRELQAVLSGDGRYAYWVEMTAERVEGLFRRRVAGGVTDRLAEGWPGHVYSLDWSANGKKLVLTGLPPIYQDVRYEYRIFDDTTNELRGPIDFRGHNVVGFDEGELIAYSADPGGHDQLVAVDVSTGEVTDLVDDDNHFASMVEDGESVTLVVDGERNGRYAIWKMRPNGTGRELLWESDVPWAAPESKLVRYTRWAGVESPGWVMVSPHQEAYPLPANGRRLLIALDGEGAEALPQAPNPEDPR